MALNSLRGSAAFKRVIARGHARRSNGIVLHWADNGLPANRYGLVAKSSVGGAVQRNRVRRWMRELLRAWQPQLQPGYDMIVIARGTETLGGFQFFAHHLSNVLTKAELMEAGHDG